ncbi:hydantoin racemase [Pestalotiopsis sp. NC0098]|nr:hydantoin racemase [Pestalotiopsis sp. NC0098]
MQSSPIPSLLSITGKSTRHINLLLINPNSTQSMTDSCLKSIQSTLPTHVTVYGFTCPEPGPSAVEGKVDAVLSAADSLRALHPLLKNDPKRFDGFLVACFSAHPLIAMLREEYEQPAIGIMEAALYASRMCGERLGVVTTSERSAVMHARSVAEYGFGNYSAGCEAGRVSVLELESLPRDVVYAGLSAAAKRLVDERGADCVCLGCAGMSGMREAVSEAVGMDERKAMVVDGVAVGIHFLTALAQENLGTPKGGVYRSSAAGRERRGQQWL